MEFHAIKYWGRVKGVPKPTNYDNQPIPDTCIYRHHHYVEAEDFPPEEVAKKEMELEKDQYVIFATKAEIKKVPQLLEDAEVLYQKWMMGETPV